jgi:CRP-like cAMP-binding protein
MLVDGPFAHKLKAFVALSDEDLATLASLHARRRRFPAGRDMIRQGQREQTAYILAEGWVCSYKLLSNGSRQILDFKIPGDLLGLRSILLRTADHNEEPITDVNATEVHRDEVFRAFSTTPSLATAMLWSASRDEALLVEHLVGLGRRNAAERTAHFFLEMAARLSLVGYGGQNGYACPLSQYLLADALGLSAVHVNRVLRELREEGLVTFQSGRVRFHNFDALVKLGPVDIHFNRMTVAMRETSAL